MPLIRLDKYLADAGYGTRSSVRELLRASKVSVNGVTVKKGDSKLDSGKDEVAVEGKIIKYYEFEYYMLYKPAGVVSATTDNRDKTVIELITENKRRDLFPVGRLDKDTEGLLLITNDGQLSNRLLTPGKHVTKTYLVIVDGMVTDKIVSGLCEGVDIGDEALTKPATVRMLRAEEAESQLELTITEGRYHQIKRMFQAFGLNVIYLKRLSMGNLILDENLAPGDYRRLTEEELDKLKNGGN
ncbi:MAG: pseudouridine synthase [Wujia sp.]